MELALRGHSDGNGKRTVFHLSYYEFILLLMLVAALDVTIRAGIIARLKTRHSEIWQRLGAPPLLHYGAADGSGRRVTGYLWKGKWFQTKDPVLIALALANFLVAIGIIALFYIQFISGF